MEEKEEEEEEEENKRNHTWAEGQEDRGGGRGRRE